MARTGTSSSPSPSWRRRRPLRRQPRREPLRCARPPCSCCTRRRSFAASRSGSSTRRGAGSSARTRCGAPQPLVASCARVRVFSLTDLPSAARGRQEGLTSLPGYLAVWWLGDAIGAVLRPRAAARSWWRTLAELGLLTLVLGAGAPRTPRPALASPRVRLAPRSPRPAAHARGVLQRRAADAWVGPVCRLVCAASFIADATLQRASRRLCNLAYSLWVVAQARCAEPSCTPASSAAVPARHRFSWYCASVSLRASSVQDRLQTSWTR